MQPLDTHCSGSFRSAYNLALNNWHLSDQGKISTIYNVAESVGKALPSTFTPSNIIHGFRDTGIFPFYMNLDLKNKCNFVENKSKSFNQTIHP